jgi:hypothetical protein
MKSVRLNVRLPGVTARTPLFRPAFHAYHGVTGPEHQAHLDEWSAQGYRMISLSVYGEADNPLYAAVWVRRAGPAWKAVHGVDAEAYVAFLNAPKDQGLGLSPVDLRSEYRVPYVYGGDGQINEVGAANHGIGASAEALTHFIHRHAVWGNGPRAAGYSRTGSGPGTSSLASSRSDGLDWTCLINTRDWPPSTSPTLCDLVNSIEELLDRATIN